MMFSLISVKLSHVIVAECKFKMQFFVGIYLHLVYLMQWYQKDVFLFRSLVVQNRLALLKKVAAFIFQPFLEHMH